MNFFVEKILRVVERHGLHILWHAQCDRTTLDRIGEHAHRLWQAGQELFGACDAVKKAAHRAKAVVGGQGKVVEILYLLQNGVRHAGREGVAGQKQHWQAVDVRHRCRGDHVHRAWSG